MKHTKEELRMTHRTCIFVLRLIPLPRAAALFVLCLPLWGCTQDTAPLADCGPGVSAQTPHGITGIVCPSLGRMGALKLAIPQHYLLGPKEYKGQSIWSPEDWKKRPKVSTLDTDLSSFAIKIRQTNFKPIETPQDWRDYDKLGHSIHPQPPENRWLHVGFEHVGNVRDAQPWQLNRKVQLKNTIVGSPYEGHFTRQKQQQWGLDHYVSDRKPSTHPDGWTYEIFYDPKTDGTFIRCKSTLRSAPLHDVITSCQHEFNFIAKDTGEIIRISASNIHVKSDLARWREVEQGLRAAFQSFIVP